MGQVSVSSPSDASVPTRKRRSRYRFRPTRSPGPTPPSQRSPIAERRQTDRWRRSRCLSRGSRRAILQRTPEALEAPSRRAGRRNGTDPRSLVLGVGGRFLVGSSARRVDEWPMGLTWRLRLGKTSGRDTENLGAGAQQPLSSGVNEQMARRQRIKVMAVGGPSALWPVDWKGDGPPEPLMDLPLTGDTREALRLWAADCEAMESRAGHLWREDPSFSEW